MPLFLAERYLPRIDDAVLDDVATKLRRRAGAQRLGSLGLADDDLCLCVFSAATIPEVDALNRQANLDYERILRVLAVPQGRFS